MCAQERGDQAACFEIAQILAIGQVSGAGKTLTARTFARFDPGSLQSHKAQAGRVERISPATPIAIGHKALPISELTS